MKGGNSEARGLSGDSHGGFTYHPSLHHSGHIGVWQPAAAAFQRRGWGALHDILNLVSRGELMEGLFVDIMYSIYTVWGLTPSAGKLDS